MVVVVATRARFSTLLPKTFPTLPVSFSPRFLRLDCLSEICSALLRSTRLHPLVHARADLVLVGSLIPPIDDSVFNRAFLTHPSPPQTHPHHLSHTQPHPAPLHPTPLPRE